MLQRAPLFLLPFNLISFNLALRRIECAFATFILKRVLPVARHALQGNMQHGAVAFQEFWIAGSECGGKLTTAASFALQYRWLKSLGVVSSAR